MPDAGSEEVHIASFVVHVHPGCLEDVIKTIGNTASLEVGPRAESGKLVVLAEGVDHRVLLEAMEGIESLPGVLECILVYHEVMTAAEAGQTLIPHRNMPTRKQGIQP